MAGTKSQRLISVEQVQQIFNDASIENLTRIAKLPANANKRKFAEGIRDAASIYISGVQIANANEIYSEIAALHRAAERRQSDRVAILIDRLSPEAQDLLNRRGELPSSKALRDELLRVSACAKVARLCRIGGKKREGRLRPSGKRSTSWQWLLYAPTPSRGFSKRKSERDFVMNIRLAWLEAVGEGAPAAANAARLGPFARMVRECFRLVGAPSSDAAIAGRINELNRIGRRNAIRPSGVSDQL